MTRNKELDIAKGIAAWLVIWGHSIQFCYAGDEAFYENIVFRFIYGFHMPFFMIISGYLFFSSCKKYDLKGIIKKQFKHIMYPLLVWNGMHWIFKLCYTRGAEIHSIKNFFISLYKSLTGLWFLWSVFIISVSIAIISFNLADGIKRAIGYIIVFCILLILPEEIEPVKTMNIWMYPYFLTGFIWAEKKRFMKRNILEYGFVILYPILIHYFHFRDYIYTSGIALSDSEYGFGKQIQIDIYRWILGYAGIIFTVIILRKLLQKANIKQLLFVLFGNLGQVTLQVYVLQRLLLVEIFGRGYKMLVDKVGGINPLTSNIWLYNLLWTPIIGLMNLLIIYKIIIVIRNNNRLSRYLFATNNDD